jgi:hypothetical protein
LEFIGGKIRLSAISSRKRCAYTSFDDFQIFVSDLRFELWKITNRRKISLGYKIL